MSIDNKTYFAVQAICTGAFRFACSEIFGKPSYMATCTARYDVATSTPQRTAVTGRITFASTLVAMVSVLARRVGVISSSPLEIICA